MSLRKDHGGERFVWTPRSIVETLSHIMSNDSNYISTSENGGVYPPLTRNRTNYPNKPRPAWIGAETQTTHDTFEVLDNLLSLSNYPCSTFLYLNDV